MDEHVRIRFSLRPSDNSDMLLLQIPRKASKVTEDDVFLLDLGETLYQYNGSAASGKEKFRVSFRIV